MKKKIEMGEEHKEAGLKETLLKKVYYGNCPGCKVDERADRRTGLPIKELLTVCIYVLCSSLPITSLFPFLYFMVRDFGIAEREEDIGSYAGYIGSAYMVGRGLTSVHWGFVADRYGRKPVIIVGAISVVITNTVFGLSTNFWTAIAMRFLLGSSNGIIGTMTAYAIEIFGKDHRALALLTVNTAQAVGMVIGPAMGGFLAQPADKYPNVFSKDSLFGRYPYFLPCFCVSLFSFGMSIAGFWLPETLHNHPEKTMSSADEYDVLESAAGETTSSENQEKKVPQQSIFKNWPLISSVIVYSIFQLQDMAYSEIFSLWAVSPRKFGGLNYTTDDVGSVLAISGFNLLVGQLALYPTVERILGPLRVCQICAALTIPVLQCFPFISLLSGLSLTLVLDSVSILRNVLYVSVITSLSIMQNNAVEQDQRGAANGFAFTAMSFIKAPGPAGAGAIFSWAQKRHNATFLPGNHMVFFLLNVTGIIGFFMTFKPFLALKKKTNHPVVE